MIGYIKGNVLYSGEGTVLLETGGVGYEILCSGALFAKLVAGGQGEAYTYLQVRDDGVSLFGFVSPEEKNMFLKLISVSGVGPKMGIAVLSSLSVGDLAVAIASSDLKLLSTVKGLGKKTAERIVLELREKVSAVPAPPGEAPAAPVSVSGKEEDAVGGLMSLGYTRSESVKAVRGAVARAQAADATAGGALEVYGDEIVLDAGVRRLAPFDTTASDIALAGMALWKAGGAVRPEEAAPLYVRNRVALTIKERAAGERL